MKKYASIIMMILSVIAMSQNTEKKIRYVALGDSYTIGTGAEAQEAWPSLLANHLSESGIATELIANPARNGYTTQNLIDKELPILEKSKADFVSLLIGVNDWVQGVNASTYKKNLVYILDQVQKSINNKQNILLISIPDFGVTPQGALYSGGRDISKGIEEFNTILKNEAEKRKLLIVDIFQLSKEMKSNSSLIAADGLHPSAAEYAKWEKVIFLQATLLLKKK